MPASLGQPAPSQAIAVIGALRKQGASLAEIAFALREMGAVTPRGDAWTTVNIKRALRRLALP